MMSLTREGQFVEAFDAEAADLQDPALWDDARPSLRTSASPPQPGLSGERVCSTRHRDRKARCLTAVPR